MATCGRQLRPQPAVLALQRRHSASCCVLSTRRISRCLPPSPCSPGRRRGFFSGLIYVRTRNRTPTRLRIQTRIRNRAIEKKITKFMLEPSGPAKRNGGRPPLAPLHPAASPPRPRGSALQETPLAPGPRPHPQEVANHRPPSQRAWEGEPWSRTSEHNMTMYMLTNMI